MYESNRYNSNSHRKNKKKNNRINDSNNINHSSNFNNNSHSNYQQNRKFYNKKRNYKNYNKKTIEEYERIYIEKKMREEGEKPICPICNESIYIIEEAIIHSDSGKYAHFECIINEIKTYNLNNMEKDERIVYLGAGTFGIIQESRHGKHSNIHIKKRINYENRKIKKINDDSDPEEDDLMFK